jgi:hypothetical protein
MVAVIERGRARLTTAGIGGLLGILLEIGQLMPVQGFQHAVDPGLVGARRGPQRRQFGDELDGLERHVRRADLPRGF